MGDIFDIFKKIGSKETTSAPVSWVVAGLGNPGKEYDGTRHNMGFMALDTVARATGAVIDRARFHALCGEATIGDTRVLLMKPETYMNNSGVAVAEALSFYKLPPERLIVVCDDISFAPGRMRIRMKGSSGGHNGLKSIIAMTGSENFIRMRLGVGEKPRPDYDLAAWVLGRFSPVDFAQAEKTFHAVAEALPLIFAGTPDLAMSRYSK